MGHEAKPAAQAPQKAKWPQGMSAVVRGRCRHTTHVCRASCWALSVQAVCLVHVRARSYQGRNCTAHSRCTLQSHCSLQRGHVPGSRCSGIGSGLDQDLHKIGCLLLAPHCCWHVLQEVHQ